MLEGPRAGRLDFSFAIEEMLQRGDTDVYRQIIDEIDRRVLTSVLAAMKGNHLRAAAILGISRATLRKKLRAMGVEPSPIKSPATTPEPAPEFASTTE